MTARVLIALASLLISFAQARSADNQSTPLQMLADLQNLQAKIAQGDKTAYAAQPAMLRDMGAAIAAADPETWKQPDNIHAAIAFLLSGGPPRAVTPLLHIEDMPKADDQLLRGALAYVVGREEEAQTLLGGLDARTLDLRLSGQVAFVQSLLIVNKDKNKAVELLDLARLLAPGGLVEEAALRREILVAAEMRDVDRFTLLSCQYLNRFSSSVYAESLVHSIAQTAARLGLAEDLVNFHKFDSLAASMPPAARRGFYLAISRAALVDGKVEVADVAARMSLAQPYGDSSQEMRAKLYGAAARVLGDRYAQSVAELAAIDAKVLPKGDVSLLAAARDVAARLRVTPAAPAALPASVRGDLAKTDETIMADIRLAEAAVARSDTLVKERTP
jgi:chemotaxis protein MotC